MNLRTWLGAAALIPVVACGGDNNGGSSDGDSQAVANALTENIRFRGGVLRRGGIPEPEADTVRLTQDENRVRIRPGQHVLMSLGIDNPEEDDDPAGATLLQFESASDHTEIEPGDAGTGSGDREVEFDVEDTVCEALCNKSFTVRMFQAVKLRSGKVSRMLNRSIELDCSEDGDEARCDGAPARPDAGRGGQGGSGGGGSGSGGSGGSGGSTPGQTNVATEFASAVAGVNFEACGTCAGMPDTPTCAQAPYSPAEVTCIRDAVAADGAFSAPAMCVQRNLAAATAACSECTSACFENAVARAWSSCAGNDEFTSALEGCGFATMVEANP
jgi:hypothetical protein